MIERPRGRGSARGEAIRELSYGLFDKYAARVSGVKVFNRRRGRGGARGEAVRKFVVSFGRRIGDARGRG